MKKLVVALVLIVGLSVCVFADKENLLYGGNGAWYNINTKTKQMTLVVFYSDVSDYIWYSGKVCIVDTTSTQMLVSMDFYYYIDYGKLMMKLDKTHKYKDGKEIDVEESPGGVEYHALKLSKDSDGDKVLDIEGLGKYWIYNPK